MWNTKLKFLYFEHGLERLIKCVSLVASCQVLTVCPKTSAMQTVNFLSAPCQTFAICLIWIKFYYYIYFRYIRRTLQQSNTAALPHCHSVGKSAVYGPHTHIKLIKSIKWSSVFFGQSYRITGDFSFHEKHDWREI